MTKLMIIGGTWEQVPLVKTAVAMGLEVVVTDPNPEAAAFEYAHATEVLSPRDLPRAVALAQKHGVSGVTADECDYSNYAAVVVSQTLGLPNRHGIEAVQLTTNKHWMRARCLQHRVLQPRFFPCRTLSEAVDAVDLIDWPVIVKPTDSRGSIGTTICRTSEQLRAAFLLALANAHSREVIVEAYVEGTHITVDGICDSNGVHHNLAVASKRVRPGARPVITDVTYPAEIPVEHRDAALNTNTRVVEALGLVGGATHAEYIIDDRGRCFLVEIANRGGGVLTSAVIIPALTGVDVSRALIDEALGNDVIVEPAPTGRHVHLTFFGFEPGHAERIAGVERALALPGVHALRLLVHPPCDIEVASSGAERHGFAILEAEDSDGVVRLRQTLLDTLEVQYR